MLLIFHQAINFKIRATVRGMSFLQFWFHWLILVIILKYLLVGCLIITRLEMFALSIFRTMC
ncbi:hypothetical protein WJ59_01335 [Burkholderia gladioli]|nr:hypothetical protein WJ59_01335 [Burkholderia gladioli]